MIENLTHSDQVPLMLFFPQYVLNNCKAVFAKWELKIASLVNIKDANECGDFKQVQAETKIDASLVKEALRKAKVQLEEAWSMLAEDVASDLEARIAERRPSE